ncbi:hypothetical protein EDD11_003239 [Mortierella claussenii]|nr:hypothetical protein EDD11_003239 [Mortierella claussenii]
MSVVREEILGSAVKLLQDRKVQASSLGKKVAFLESKGLTSPEIEEAMARANGASSGIGVATVPVQQRMVPHQGLGQKVISSKPQWPSQEDPDLDKKELDEQFEEIEKSLAESNDAKREQELAGLRTDINNIKAMIPSLMEKNKGSQENTLNELKTQIKSLKSLLLNRRGGPTDGPGTPVSSSNAAGAALCSTIASYSSAASSIGGTSIIGTLPTNDVAMNFLNTKVSIPAWQLAAQKSVVN